MGYVLYCIIFWIETNETNKKRRNEYELYKQRH
jgi:hypothetical protein